MAFALNSELFYNSQGYFQGGVKGKLSHLRGVASYLKLIILHCQQNNDWPNKNRIYCLQ